MRQGFFHASTLAQMKGPVGTVAKCGACRLYTTCQHGKMPYTGQGRKGILIVGEAPGEEEDKRNVQFVGRAGQALRERLVQVGVNLDRDCWKTNALICRPPGNATPTPDQIEWCRPNLMNTIKELNPTVIILLGGVAVKALLERIWREDPGGIYQWAGFRIPSQQLNAWVCPTYHPSYIIREEKNKPLHLWWERHLEAAADLAGTRPWAALPDYKAQVEVTHDSARAADVVRRMVAKGGRAAFDYECTTLKPDGPHAQIVTASVCWEGKKTIAFPWHGEAVEAMREFVLAPNVHKIASNMKFEDRWTRRHLGTRVKAWLWDTMLAAHHQDPRPGITSIKFQSMVHLGFPAYDDHIQFKEGDSCNDHNRILQLNEINDLLLYNGLDSLLEYEVAIRQMKVLYGGGDG